MASSTMPSGEGNKYVGMLNTTDASCQIRRNDTIAIVACGVVNRRARAFGAVTPVDARRSLCNVFDVSAICRSLFFPQDTDGLEDAGDTPSVFGEFRHVAHRKPARPWQVYGDDVFDAPRARRHDDNPVAEKHSFGDRMRHEHDGLARLVPESQKIDVELVARKGVESSKGLIHQQQIRIMQQCATDRDALAHTAGQVMRIQVLESVELDEA